MEVFESRGMTVCEEALKKLKSSKKKSVKAILYINGDGLRVVDYETKGLLLDQTIEKVSFCAPDHNYERGFSYICRDGTTRRWICHGFMAVKETVSILSATPTTPSFVSLSIMVIRVVEFSNGGYKIRRFLPKNQHTQRKLLNFENWISGGLRSFQKLEF